MLTKKNRSWHSPCVLLLAGSLALWNLGCATVPTHRVSRAYTDVRDLAQKYAARYDYDVFLETIKIENEKMTCKALLDSSLVLYNGNLYDLRYPVEYRQGNVYIPDTIHDVFSQKEAVRPVSEALIKLDTIILDAGHGGKDPGARYGGVEEKTLNLKVVRLLKKELEKYGIKVVLSRSDDRYVALKKRVRIAADSPADMFISIHMNASRNKRLQGFEIYYLSERFTSEQSKEIVYKENIAFPQEVPEQTSLIIKDMLSQENRKRSLEMAHAIYRSASSFGLKTRCIRGAPFYVLKYNKLPSILVEVAYLSNSFERSQLLKESFINQVVEAITLGIINLKKRYTYLSSTPNG